MRIKKEARKPYQNSHYRACFGVIFAEKPFLHPLADPEISTEHQQA